VQGLLPNIFLGLAGVLNLLFLVIPIAVWRNARKTSTWWILVGASTFTLIAGLVVPLAFMSKVTVLSGYFVWLTGHVLLFIVAASRIRSRYGSA
jgi:hypothetical protein